jgi:hypothetical protein
MSNSSIKFPSSPSSSEDDLPSHQSSEKDVSSDDWMSSSCSPLWSSEKEDPEKEDEDEDEEEDADDDDDSNSDSNDSDFDSNSDSDFDSPPPKRARRA